MRIVIYIAIILVLATFNTARRSKKCMGLNGKNYGVGKGYEEICKKFTCTKTNGKKKRLKMLETDVKNCCKNHDSEVSRCDDAGSFADKWNTRDKSNTDGFTWMGNVDSRLRLNQLSIPGTHDTMTFKTGELPWYCHQFFYNCIDIATCQNRRLRKQLEIGVRFIDIRLNLTPKLKQPKTLACYHGLIPLGSTLDDVLLQITNWVHTYPTETVIMRYSRNNKYDDISEFCSLFNERVNRWSWYIWKWKVLTSPHQDSFPTLGDTRGKLVLLNSDDLPNCFGFTFPNITLDNYEGKGIHPLTGKQVADIYEVKPYILPYDVPDWVASDAYKKELEEFLNQIREQEHTKNKMIFTYASAVHWWFCNPECMATDVNPYMASYFKRLPFDSVGIVAFDFIDKWNSDLPKLIYERNYNTHLCKGCSACKLYKNRNYGGPFFTMKAGSSIPDLSAHNMNDQVSSFTVKSTCYMEVWVDPNYSGQKGNFINDGPDLKNGPWLHEWNDAISSVKCTCMNILTP